MSDSSNFQDVESSAESGSDGIPQEVERARQVGRSDEQSGRPDEQPGRPDEQLSERTSEDHQTLSDVLISGWDTAPELDRTLSEALGGMERDMGAPLRFSGAVRFSGTVIIEDSVNRHLLRECEAEPAEALSDDPLATIGLTMVALASPEALPELAREESQVEDSLLLPVGAPGTRPNWAQGLRLSLAEQTVIIGPPWAQFFAELRAEIARELDPELRSSFIYLLAKIVQLRARVRVGGALGVTDPSVMRLAQRIEAAACDTLRPARVALVARVAQTWEAADTQFREAIDQLEVADARQNAVDAGQRRVSIVVERLRAGNLDIGEQARLEPWLYAPETLSGLSFRGVRAHQQRARAKAAQVWQRLARHLPPSARPVVMDAGAYFMRATTGFVQWMMGREEDPDTSRAQLLMMQRRAMLAGDHHAEAVALHELVRHDVAAGRRLLERVANGEGPAARQDDFPEGSEAPTSPVNNVSTDLATDEQKNIGGRTGRERLQALAAARFFRLAGLLRGLKRAREPIAQSLEELGPQQLLFDAVALRPQNRVYLRRLARWSQQRGDLETYAKSLRTLARSYTEPQLAALAATELARAVYLGDGQLQRSRERLVERYLREALVYDSECAPARLALRRLGLMDESLDLPHFEPPSADEAAFFDARDWHGLAKLLTQKLEVESDEYTWAKIAYRLTQIHAWHLSPVADGRLRVEFLEQVLIAQPEHLPALIELLDVRLARREYGAAMSLIERLARQAATEVERAFWLTELADLLEQELGLAQRAAGYFRQALELHPDNITAFLGVLRTDFILAGTPQAERGVQAIVERLNAGISVHEAEELAVELMLRADELPAARRALSAHFPDDPLWQFICLCEAIEGAPSGADPGNEPRGDKSARRALNLLRRMWLHPDLVELLDIFEDFGLKTRDSVAENTLQAPISVGLRLDESDPDMTRSQESMRQAISAQLSRLKAEPSGEGRMIRVMREAAEVDDPEMDLLLAAVGARRSPDHISRVTQLVWMALNFSWLGEDQNALKICEYVLDNWPDFLPALKLARILGVRLGRWADVTRWCEAQARRTRLDWVAFESRRMASQIQQDYLGDIDAACRQFRLVLNQDPAHPEAFEKLKSMLLTRGRFDEVLTIFEQRLSYTPSAEQRAELLNEMAQIALYRQHDGARARAFLTRSHQTRPGQLRVLRILGELHQEQGDFKAAIDAYREAINLAESAILIERLWVGIAELAEQNQDPPTALEAYRLALETNPERSEHLVEIARLNMARGTFDEALIYLDWLIEQVKDSATPGDTELLQVGLFRRAQCLIELKKPREAVLAAFSELILNYPEMPQGVDALQAYLGEDQDESIAAEERPAESSRVESSRVENTPAGENSPNNLEDFLADLSVRAFLEMHGRPFDAHFQIARRLNHADRAFQIAAVAEVLGYASPLSHEFYQSRALPRRWPTRPLPDLAVPTLTPAGLAPAFIGLLRQSESALIAGLSDSTMLAQLSRYRPQNSADQGENTQDARRPEFIAQDIWLDDPSLEPALKNALKWPGLFGMELSSAAFCRMPAESLGAKFGSLILLDNAADALQPAAPPDARRIDKKPRVRLFLDPAWQQLEDPTEWLVHLGRQLAGWRLGIGRWQYLDMRTRFQAVSQTVGSFATGWDSVQGARSSQNFDPAAFSDQLLQTGTLELAIHARDLADTLSLQAIEPQFRLLELTLERAACLLIDDPARALPHTKYLGSEHGMLQQPWTFLFSPRATQLRRQIGLSFLS